MTASQTTYPNITYPCPQCGSKVDWTTAEHKPFCSERCKWIDFGGWANEEYRLPSQEPTMSSNFDDGTY